VYIVDDEKKTNSSGVVGAREVFARSEVSAAEAMPAGEQTCVEGRGFHYGDTVTCVTEAGPRRDRVEGFVASEVGQGSWRVRGDVSSTLHLEPMDFRASFRRVVG